MFRKCDFSPFFGTNFWQIYTFLEDKQKNFHFFFIDSTLDFNARKVTSSWMPIVRII